ncbi:MAG TPA: transposase [Planctomycetota bacterium]|nr:transposase [Planctomycetota bacterium]
MRRFEVDPQQWHLIKDLFLASKPRGRHPADPRRMINGCFWILHTGAQWRDLPRETYGPWSTVYDHFRKWRLDGTWDRVLSRLEVRLDREGRIDWDLWCVDGTTVRASRSAAGAGKRGDPQSPGTTHWVAREAGLGRSSTWSLAVTEPPSGPASVRARITNPGTSKKPSDR